MQGVQRAVAVFCIGCIGAELLAQLVGEDWPRRCIKALAGLYILVALARGLPLARDALPLPAPVQAAPAALGSAEDAVLRQAEQQLAQVLAAQCAQQTGVSVQLRITLSQTGQGVVATGLCAALAGGASEQARAETAQLLEEALGIPPVWVEGGGLCP